MTRGKHATSAEARRAREQAIAETDRLTRVNIALEQANESLNDQLAELKRQVAAGVSADLARVEKRLTESEAEIRHLRGVLGEAAKAIRDAYEGTVLGLRKFGVPHDVACDRADEVTKFLIGDELLGAGEVQAFWVAEPKVRLSKVIKIPQHKNRGVTVADRIDASRNLAAFNRQKQGIE